LRFDRKVTLIKQGEEVYDYNTGDYVLSEPIIHNMWANISDAGLEERQAVFGGVDVQGLVVRFRHRLPAFDTLDINGQAYNAKTVKRLRHKTVLFVSEKQ